MGRSLNEFFPFLESCCSFEVVVSCLVVFIKSESFVENVDSPSPFVFYHCRVDGDIL